MSSPEPIAVYIHTPFCPSKCGYCDFNSYAMSGDIMGRTTDAICREIESSPLRGLPAKTIFFGGGTPTYLPTDQLLRILKTALACHPPVDGCEITSEANPGTVDAEKFSEMHEAGFNRISLGAQSFLNTDLLRLDRVHQAGDIGHAFHTAKRVGFKNVNLDLMFALPGQALYAWKQNLDRLFELAPEHISLYCLTIEENTKFYKLALRGQLDLPDDEAQVRMYDECLIRATAAGYEQYEISNFAKPGHRCVHNLCYWHGEPYAGYGPGAVGATPASTWPSASPETLQVRRTNWKHPDRYCEALEAGRAPYFEFEELNASTLRTEQIMLGLRLNEGIPRHWVDESLLAPLIEKAWLEIDSNQARLTPTGRHFCSEVALALI